MLEPFTLKYVFSSHLTLFMTLIFISTAVLIALVKPYKKTHMNVLDTLLLSLTVVLYYLLSTEYTPTQDIIQTTASFSVLVILHLYCNLKSVQKCQALLRRNSQTGSAFDSERNRLWYYSMHDHSIYAIDTTQCH